MLCSEYRQQAAAWDSTVEHEKQRRRWRGSEKGGLAGGADKKKELIGELKETSLCVSDHREL